MLFTFLSPGALKYCQFLSVAAFMFCGVDANTQSVRLTHCPRENMGSSGHVSPANPHRTLSCARPVQTQAFRYRLQIP